MESLEYSLKVTFDETDVFKVWKTMKHDSFSKKIHMAMINFFLSYCAKTVVIAQIVMEQNTLTAYAIAIQQDK